MWIGACGYLCDWSTSLWKKLKLDNKVSPGWKVSSPAALLTFLLGKTVQASNSVACEIFLLYKQW